VTGRAEGWATRRLRETERKVTEKVRAKAMLMIESVGTIE
jgi:hypothetical protein